MQLFLNIKETNNSTEYQFSDEEVMELEKALFGLTNRLFVPNGPCNGAIPSTTVISGHFEKVKELEKRREAILNSSLSVVQKIYWLLEELRM